MSSRDCSAASPSSAIEAACVVDEGAPLLVPLDRSHTEAAAPRAENPSAAGASEPVTTGSAIGSLRAAGRHILGASLLILVAAIWVGASALVQFVFSNSSNASWLFLTTVNVSEFAVLLPIEALVVTWKRSRRRRGGPDAPRVEGATEDTDTGGSSAGGASHTWAADYGFAAALRTAALIAPVWLVAQSTYNWALAGVSVSTSTVLATTSCVWTFLLSWLVLHEPFAWTKAAGVAVTLLGAGLVALDGTPAGGAAASSSSSSTWWGIALSLLSAVAYGCYTTAIRRLVPEGGPVRVQMLFGCIGALCCVTLGPLVAVLHVTGAMRVPPLGPSLVALILCKGALDNVLSDLLWAWAIQLTSATLATIGLALTIPFAMVSDYLLQGAEPHALMAAGSCCVVAGFLLTTVALQHSAPHKPPLPPAAEAGTVAAPSGLPGDQQEQRAATAADGAAAAGGSSIEE